MIVIIKTLTDEAVERRDYCSAYTIDIDGKKVFQVYDGEPEDNNLFRNFSDIYGIPEIIYRSNNRGVTFTAST